MGKLMRQGDAVFAFAMVAFGVISLTYVGHPPGNTDILSVIAVAPVLGWMPGGRLVPYLASAVLIAAGTAFLAGWQRRRAAMTLATTWAVWVLLLSRPAVRQPVQPGRLDGVL